MFFDNPSEQVTPTTARDVWVNQDALTKYASISGPLDFEACNFSGVRFDGLLLKDWNFYGCNLDAVSFGTARLENVRWLGCRARHASFRGALLTHVRISESQLAYTDWDCSELDDIVFNAVDLTAAWFKGARLKQVTAFDCQLNEVDLTLADLRQSCVEKTHASLSLVASEKAPAQEPMTDVLGVCGALHGQKAG